MRRAPRVRAAGLGGDAADPRLARLVAGLLAGQPQSIAFTRVNGQGRVFTLEVVAAGGEGRVVRLAQASSQLLPSWSPDSSRIAYQSGGRIYTVARDGSGRRFVTTGLYPDWSPDGTSIAYVRAGALRVGAKVLATQVIWKPDWSPDGASIAFARSDGIHVVTRRGCRAHGRANRGRAERRRSGRSTGRSSRTASPAACTSSRPTEQRRARLVAGPFRTLSPLSWAPTGDALAYTADGAVRLTWLGVTSRTEYSRVAAEVGASFAPGDLHGYLIAYSALRKTCPGHSAIRVGDGPVLSGTCTIAGTAAADVIEGTPVRRRRDPRRRGQRQGARERRPHRPCGLRPGARHGLGRPHGSARALRDRPPIGPSVQ